METSKDTTSLDLRSLFETSKLFNSTYELSFISQHILRTIMGKFLITKGFLFLLKQGKLNQISKRGQFSNLLDTIQTEDQLLCFSEQNEMEIFPLTSNEITIGFLGVGKPLNRNKLSDVEINFLKSLLEFTTNAIENSIRFSELKESNHDLAKKIQEVRTLYEISSQLNGLTDRNKVFQMFTFTVLGQGVFNGVAIYQQQPDKSYRLQYQKGYLQINPDIRAFDFTDVECYEINSSHTWYSDLLGGSGDEHILLIPIKSHVSGFVVLRKSQLLSQDELKNYDFYLSLTHLLDITLSTIIYFEETLLKQQLENDIKVAGEIQSALLPSKFPVFGDLDCYGVNIPCKTIGGDYFDIWKIDENRLLVAIADVTGKGVPAGLLMANLQSMIKILIPLNLTLSDMTSRINQVIYENTSPDKFITFFWGLLDRNESRLTYVNAGHNPPYIIRNGQLIELNEGGVILGVIPSVMPYQTGRVEFKQGDKLFIFTDGITEAMNEENKEFSDERLKEILIEWNSQSAKEWTDFILSEVRKFTGTASQSDDITIVSVKW